MIRYIGSESYRICQQPATAAAVGPAGGPAGGQARAAEPDIEVRRAAGAARRPHLLSDERDGLSDRPPAAVLLLVLGTRQARTHAHTHTPHHLI